MLKFLLQSDHDDSMRGLPLLFMLLSLFSALNLGAGEVEIQNYEYKEYNRYPRMEEEDRLRGRVFSFRPGLEIITDLEGVEIRFFEEYIGRTPWEADDLPRQNYRVRLEKSGYEILEFWVAVIQDYRTVVLVTMGEPQGSLEITRLPPGAEVSLGRAAYEGGVQNLPAGPQTLVVRAFGYEPVKETITIKKGESLLWEYQGKTTPFALSQLQVHPRINDPGDLRGNRLRFSASAPGRGRLEIFDPQNQLVYEESYPELTARQETRWNSGQGGDLPPGTYRVRVEGTGEDGLSSRLETSFQLDRRFRRIPLTFRPGVPGLLYSPAADMLPAGIFQLGTGAGGFFLTGGEGFSIPAWAGGRGSVAPRWETGSLVEINARDPFDTTSVGISVYGAWRGIPSPGPLQTNLTLSFAYRGYAANFARVPLESPFPEVPGLSLGMPWQLAFQGWGVILAPQITLTFLAWEGDYWRFALPARVAGTLGLGIYQEGPRHRWGVSGMLRTPSFPAGPLDWGIWSGIEGRLTLPGDSAYLSAMAGVQALPAPVSVLIALGLGLTS